MMATVEEIKDLWAHVDALEKQTAELVKELEASRWKLAEWLYGASEAGATQRPLAKKVGKSQTLVSHYINIWLNHKDQPEAERPPFAALLAERTKGSNSRARLPGERASARTGEEPVLQEPELEVHGPDYRGNRSPIPECEPITMIGKALAAMDSLVALDPKEVVLLLLDDEYHARLVWANSMSRWVADFMEALDERFLHSPNPISAA